jgi:hypothetical protein
MNECVREGERAPAGRMVNGDRAAPAQGARARVPLPSPASWWPRQGGGAGSGPGWDGRGAGWRGKGRSRRPRLPRLLD